MRAIYVDLRRAIINKWFLITLVGTLALLWIGLGPQSTSLTGDILSGYRPQWNMYLYMALTSSASTLTLPSLAALP